MKVNIGPYLTWWGPYQLAELLQKVGVSKKTTSNIGYRLSKTWLADACQWVYDLRTRKIKVKIDDYDVWSLDSTLAVIILPALKKLKEQKRGSPIVDLEDVPEHLRYTQTEDYYSQLTFAFYNEGDKIECDVHTRWEWVMNEMIWSFETLLDENADEKFWSVKPILDLEKYPEDEGKNAIPVRWKQEGVCDWVGLRAMHDRMDNGFRLFGKYYRGLWD